MRRPRIFRSQSGWTIAFVLDGQIARWTTAKWDDALAFALNLAALRSEGLRRAA